MSECAVERRTWVLCSLVFISKVFENHGSQIFFRIRRQQILVILTQVPRNVAWPLFWKCGDWRVCWVCRAVTSALCLSVSVQVQWSLSPVCLPSSLSWHPLASSDLQLPWAASDRLHWPAAATPGLWCSSPSPRSTQTASTAPSPPARMVRSRAVMTF